MGQQCCAVDSGESKHDKKKKPTPKGKTNKRREDDFEAVNERKEPEQQGAGRRKIQKEDAENKYAAPSTPREEPKKLHSTPSVGAAQVIEARRPSELEAASESEDYHVTSITDPRGSLMSESGASTHPPLTRIDTSSPSQMLQPRRNIEPLSALQSIDEQPQARDLFDLVQPPSDQQYQEYQSVEEVTDIGIVGVEDVVEQDSTAAATSHLQPTSQKASKYFQSDNDTTATEADTANKKISTLKPQMETTRNRKFQFASTNLFPQQVDFNSEDAPAFQFAPTNLFQQRVSANKPFLSGGMVRKQDPSTESSSSEDDNEINGDVNKKGGGRLYLDDDDDIMILDGNETNEVVISTSDYVGEQQPIPMVATVEDAVVDGETVRETAFSEEGTVLETNTPLEGHSVGKPEPSAEAIVVEAEMAQSDDTVPSAPSAAEVVEKPQIEEDEDDSALYGPQPLLNGYTAEDVLKLAWFRNQKVDPPRVLWRQTETTVHIRVEPANNAAGWEIIDVLDELHANQSAEKFQQTKNKLQRISAVKDGPVGRIIEFSCEDQGIPLRAVLPLLEPVQECTFTLVTEVSQDDGIHGGPPHLEITCHKVPAQYLHALTAAAPTTSMRVDSDEDSGSDVESDSEKKLVFNKWSQLLEVHQRTYMKLYWIKEVSENGAVPTNEYVYQGIYREGFQDTSLFAEEAVDDGGFSDDD